MKRSIAAMVFLLACSKSNRTETYEKLEKDANPILVKLRPTAVRILELGSKADPESRSELVRLCASADSELDALYENLVVFDKLDEATGGPDTSAVEVPTSARQIVLGRLAPCSGSVVDDCSSYCLGRWRFLVESVDRLNQRARRDKADVRFEELR